MQDIDKALAQMRTCAQAATELGVSVRQVQRLALQHGLGWRPDERTVLLRPQDMATLRAHIQQK